MPPGPSQSHLGDGGGVEPEAICYHHVDVSLPILLPHALVGGQARERVLQGRQPVTGGQAHVEQLAWLEHTHTQCESETCV